ncbi:MAG: bifunctional phosphoribosylaminoimidazolecarboxamide formyltransferase/IMP cyclohydrolase [Methanospirillum sp.]|uniref:bifunctional phosphoribosylaminoimidazolecarboxamide formyltransferase/IMP cyclohydrolase n=1 Tax=Methanospirillum sp. TaxID=45200 RepID=UPI00236E23EB|nr:bifunctional phosphoribosylaminoimidazolecarboxamide formyltransferase/IMP cyclohydrolase [Methanospirillum sp.]MDD1727998.1 bifunctional phosphoribosylaminoimidazolecarboxamide formyltransferase/IMP cyclohydrolase [Methanospirillum sp.]
MKRALLSVWNKDGIIELARALAEAGVEILSSGGTAKTLEKEGIPIIEVSTYTGHPEMMNGRVKTLHPRIHGGLLGRRGKDDAEMQQNNINPIDLLVVNLYPFEEMAKQALPLDELIEFIDIGGPAMIRAAAKNFRDVIVVIDPEDYPALISAIKSDTPIGYDQRLALARKVFTRMAAYDGAISNYLQSLDGGFPDTLSVQFGNRRELRYGENPHQKAAVYGESGIAGAVPVQGKAMSYNNYLDLDAAVSLLREFSETAAVIVKHNNPCGVAIGPDVCTAYLNARESDPVSAYGGIVAVNREVGEELAKEIASTFIEVLIAPSYTVGTLPILARKENMRVLKLPEVQARTEIRTIDGGALVQRNTSFREEWEVVTDRDPTAAEEAAMHLAMKVCKHTKSNAIIFADSTKAIGIGAGQMNRVDSARIAVSRSLAPLKGTAVASDAFLPFPDTLQVAAEAGATALIQPGGSIRDEEVIAEANRLNIAMVFTGVRYFRH